jgi:lipoate-protein ligase A
MKEQWLYWQDGTHDPYFNMAVDEILLANSALLDGKVLVRVYRWDRPSVSFGSSQICPQELADKYTLVRRPTGGGVVYHDVDLTYTVVVPPGHSILQLDRMESYKVFHEALLIKMTEDGVAAVLEDHGTDHVDRATMQCFVSPSRFDLVAPSGSKYAGAAQRRTRMGILHQGPQALKQSFFIQRGQGVIIVCIAIVRLNKISKLFEVLFQIDSVSHEDHYVFVVLYSILEHVTAEIEPFLELRCQSLL